MIDKARNRKAIKTIGFATIASLLFLIYFLFFYNKLEIVVFNRTAYNIDSLKFDNRFFSIKKGDSLLIDNCKSISMQSDLPFGLPQANIAGKTKDTFMLWFCGTGVKKIKSGQYKFDITMSEDSNFFRLYWQGHK
jgi:hypothetical protein